MDDTALKAKWGFNSMAVPSFYFIMEAKIKNMIDMRASVDVTGVRSFFELAEYSQKFVNNFSGLVTFVT